MHPDSITWKLLEYYGTRVHHKGKWRIHEFLLKFVNVKSSDLTVEREGLRWRLNPSDFVHSSLYWRGEFEIWDAFHIRSQVRPDSVIFDLGANFGYYSVTLGSLLSSGHVYAFEPSKQTFDRLTTNLKLNGLTDKVTAVNVALSDSRGEAFLSSDPENSGHKYVSSEGEAIVLDTLDDFCERAHITRLDLIKIDIEGNEMRAFRGAEKTIRQFRPVMMVEIAGAFLEEQGSSAKELVDWITGLGYQLWEPRRTKLVPFARILAKDEFINVFALPS